MATTMKLAIIATMALVVLAGVGDAQHCGCPKTQCCSKWGYCGTTKAYCGEGCKQGACWGKTPPATPKPKPTPTPTPTPSGCNIESIVTKAFFNRIKAGTSSACKGKAFYTHAGFITAAKKFPRFGCTANLLARKREVAAFFANMAHETGNMCYTEEIAKRTYCSPNAKYPCQKGKMYFGRGPLQLTWNYNYGAAGAYLGKDLLHHPELVSSDPAVAFMTSLWYWNVNRRCHADFLNGKGFQATIRCINGGECGNPNYRNAVATRVNNYKKFCSWLGVTPGLNLSC